MRSLDDMAIAYKNKNTEAKIMKKYLFVFALLLCVGSLFGQDLFSIAANGTPEDIQAAIKAGA
jgi:hypothetical protein